MIESTVIEGIGPFRRRCEFPVADLGLVLVRGDNRVSSAFNDCGSGKSALFSFGHGWGLFDETFAGESGDAVLNRFLVKGPGTVENVGVDPITKRRWRLVRGRRPKRVEAYEWDDRSPGSLGWCRVLDEADDRDVNAWVEARYLPKRVHRYAVVFDRDVRFAGQDQGEAMRLLDRIQGVDFRAALDRAKAWKGVVAEALANARVTVLSDASTLDEVRGQVAEMGRLRDGFRDDVKRRVAEAQTVLSAAEEEDRFASKSLSDARDAARNAVVARKAFARVETLAREAEEATRDAGAAAREIERADAAVEEVARRINALVKAGKCAACRQPTRDAKKIGAGFAEDATAATTRRRVAGEDLKRAQAAERAASEALGAALKGVSLAVREREVCDLEAAGGNAVVRSAEIAVDLAAHRIEDATSALVRARAETWTGDAALRVARDRVEELEASIAAAERDAEKHARLLRVAEYWVEAFGDRGVRSLLFDSVAGFLTERAAVHLEALAAGEVRLPFSATFETKRGATKEGLTIVPDWAWGGLGQLAESGGQNCVTDLATFWAVRDLAESRSARPIVPAVLDEPDGLDARGQELFGAWVGAEARRLGTVFVMTHNPALASVCEPDEEWRVVLHGPGDATLEREK